MPSFTYEALDQGGSRLTGIMEGDSPTAVLRELDRAGYLPLRAVAARDSARRGWRDLLTPEPGHADVTALTLDIVMLLKGGVTLSEALGLLAGMGGQRWRRPTVEALRRSLAVGRPFSAALAEHPRLFPPLYLRMVQVAETTGRLAEALADLAEERQRVERLRRRLLGALGYPAFLIVSALAATVFIFLAVIPQFETALEGFRDKVDPTALMVFNASRFLRENLQTIGVGCGLGLLALLLASRFVGGRRMWIGLASRAPGLRTLLGFDTTVTFCRTLAVLTGNGVDISSTLRLLRTMVVTADAERRMDGVIGDVRRGRRLSDALAAHPFLPAHVVQMLRVGEESGDVADSARRVSAFYEARLEAASTRLIAVIGPLAMIAVSVLIAWLIISVMTALLSVNDLLQ